MRKNHLQESFYIPKSKKVFGGSLLKKSNPKKARPISIKNPMHLVLKSSVAKGNFSMRRGNKYKLIELLVKRQAKKWGIKIYRFENVHNHLHLLFRGTHRKYIQGFIRSVTGIIPRLILGAQKGAAKGIKFWDQRPFTRIVTWGRDYKNLLRYMDKNKLQALGFDLNALAQSLNETPLDSG